MKRSEKKEITWREREKKKTRDFDKETNQSEIREKIKYYDINKNRHGQEQEIGTMYACIRRLTTEIENTRTITRIMTNYDSIVPQNFLK